MNPFGGCHADLKNESKALIYEHNILFNKDKTTIISYRAKDANYVIPDSVTSIQACAFLGCNSLTAENGGYPPTQNGDIRSLFWLFSLMALQN